MTYQVHLVRDVAKHNLFYMSSCQIETGKVPYRCPNVLTHTNSFDINNILRMFGSLLREAHIQMGRDGIETGCFLSWSKHARVVRNIIHGYSGPPSWTQNVAMITSTSAYLKRRTLSLRWTILGVHQLLQEASRGDFDIWAYVGENKVQILKRPEVVRKC